MKRVIWIAIRGLIVIAIAVYLIDWAVLRLRMMHGTGYGTVQVEEYLSTPLKGNKAQYDYLGTSQAPCARALFPHGEPPCWWLQRHPTRWE
jgi:hypothetical protein